MPAIHRLPLIAISMMCLYCVTGCFKAKTVLKVNPDGSGTLTESIGMSKQALEQMEAMMTGFAQSMGSEGEVKPKGGFLSEDSFKQKVNDYGVGVSFVGSEKSETDGMVQTVATYAIKDVNKVKLASSNSPDMSSPGEAKKAGAPPFRFSLKQLPAGVSELTIKLPPPKPRKDKPDEKDQGDDGQAGAQQGDGEMPPAMLQMFKDLEMGIALECGKEILETNATYVKGNRITLVQFAFAKLMEQQDTLQELQKLGPAARDLETIKPLLKDIEGIKFELEREVVVKFR